MPKVSKGARRLRQSKPESAVKAEKKVESAEKKPKESKDATEATSSLSRGQRKRQAKRDQYLRREKMVLSSLKLKKEDDQRKRIDGLDAIKEALLETVAAATSNSEQAEKKTTNLLKSNKSRQKLAVKESNQMALVMQHPAFKADPFETIREHLKNTLANDRAKNAKDSTAHQKEMKKKAEDKKVAKKESGAKRRRKKFKPTRSRGR